MSSWLIDNSTMVIFLCDFYAIGIFKNSQKPNFEL